MPVRISEEQIAALLAERKTLSADWRSRLTLKLKTGHKERDLEVTGDQGSRFIVKVRQSISNSLDFSVILGYRFLGSSQTLRLRRYNGLSHEHTNTLERRSFYGYHVHMATERYQERDGFREDHFAEATSDNSSVDEALVRMLMDCGFDAPGGIYLQGSLFRSEL